jgi:uncharacterized membrane protein YeaQ/YmgE (transglycosylase-associated protein family)
MGARVQAPAHEERPQRPFMGIVAGTMSLASFLVLLLIAGVCGAIGRSIAGYTHSGCLGSIALGFIGALLGTWLARHLHLPELLTVHVGGESFPVLWSIIGSSLFVAVLSLFTRRTDR